MQSRFFQSIYLWKFFCPLFIMSFWLTGATIHAQGEHDSQRWQKTFSTINRDSTHVSKPQFSTDGRFVAVTTVPLGTETASWARTELYETETGKLRHVFPGYTPRWLGESNEEQFLQLETLDRSMVTYIIGDTIQEAPLPRNVQPIPPTQNQRLSPISPDYQFTVDLDYPTTIRVAHHPSNGCRDIPEWQVDVIPFEEYIARVVPAETPAGWPVDALAAQAVAARTYAWRQILAQRAEYDVTDWANFQMMCDKRYPNSDTAVTLDDRPISGYAG